MEQPRQSTYLSPTSKISLAKFEKSTWRCRTTIEGQMSWSGVPCQLTTKTLSSWSNPKAQKATKKKGNGGEKDRTRFFMKSKMGKSRVSSSGEWERNVVHQILSVCLEFTFPLWVLEDDKLCVNNWILCLEKISYASMWKGLNSNSDP